MAMELVHLFPFTTSPCSSQLISRLVPFKTLPFDTQSPSSRPSHLLSIHDGTYDVRFCAFGIVLLMLVVGFYVFEQKYQGASS